MIKNSNALIIIYTTNITDKENITNRLILINACIIHRLYSACSWQ